MTLKSLHIKVGEYEKLINVDTQLSDTELIDSIDTIDFVLNKIEKTKVINIYKIDNEQRYTQIHGEKR